MVVAGVSVFLSARPFVAADDVEQRIAGFWKRIDALGPFDHVTASDIGQWAVNVIERDRSAAISLTDFRTSTQSMQLALDRAAAAPPAPADPAVEERITRFWRRVDALMPGAYLTAADLGEWGVNVKERDPGARIRVDDFRASTAAMQAAFDRARVTRPAPTPTTVPLRDPSTLGPGVYTIAGAGPGDIGDGRAALSAQLKEPWGLFAAPNGELYVADTANNRIRKVAADGTIWSVAGFGSAESLDPRDGVAATESPLRLPRGVVVGRDGAVYIADTNYYLIRRIDPTGVIRTIAGDRRGYPAGDGGPALLASFGHPFAIAVDDAGGVYVADRNVHRVRYVAPTGTIATVLGQTAEGVDTLTAPQPTCGGLSGPASDAVIVSPSSLAVDGVGGLLIGTASCGVVRLDIARRTVSVLASSNSPVASSRNGDAYIVVGGELRRVDVRTGASSVLAVSSDLASATALTATAGGVVFASDAGRNLVWKVAAGTITRFAGTTEPPRSVTIGDSQGVGADGSGNVYFTDFYGHRIMRLATTGDVTVVAGTGRYGLSDVGGHPLLASFANPTALRFDAFGRLFFVDETGGNGVVLRVDPGADGVIDGSADERITAVAGRLRPRAEADHGTADGSPATLAVFVAVRDIAFGPSGDLFLADWLDHRVRRVVPGGDGMITGAADEVISTVAGNGVEAHQGDGGPATAASVYQPNRLAIDAEGSVYIAQANTGRQNIRRIDARTALISAPFALSDISSSQMTFGPDDRLYYSDRLRILRVDPTTGGKTVIAGSGAQGFNGDVQDPLRAQFSGIGFFTVDTSGHVIAADNGNSRIVRIVPTR